MPRSTEEEKAVRRTALQDALKGASGPPLEVMEVASSVLLLAEALVPIGNPSAVSDVGVAVTAARAAFHGARLNVEINLAAVSDEAWVSLTRARVGEFR